MYNVFMSLQSRFTIIALLQQSQHIDSLVPSIHRL